MSPPTANLAIRLEDARILRESWKYTNLPKLWEHLLDSAEHKASPQPKAMQDFLPSDDGIVFVFVDGVFQDQASRLQDAPPGLLQGDAASGYRISLAGQTCLVTQPVELRFVTTPETKAREISVAIKIEIGGNGRLTLLERHGLVAGAPVAHMQDMEITLAPQAKLVHGKIVAGGAVAHLAKTKVMVEAGAYYNNFSLITGGRPTRNELTVDLKGAEAQAGLNGAMLLRASDHADTLTQLTHQAPFGTSRQVYKTVLDDRAHGVFQGKIHVAEGAQKTDGYQLSRALLLSDQAEMDAKPELEIYADDVKCSHGSTVGDLDADAMFYLRTRGLSESQARGLLIQGFVGEILDEIAAPEWRALFQHEVEGWLNERA